MISAQLECETCETAGAEAFAWNELQRNNVLVVGNVIQIQDPHQHEPIYVSIEDYSTPMSLNL